MSENIWPMKKQPFLSEEERITMATYEPQCCCGVTIWQSRKRVDLEQKKTVFPGQMFENKGNYSALSGLTDAK